MERKSRKAAEDASPFKRESRHQEALRCRAALLRNDGNAVAAARSIGCQLDSFRRIVRLDNTYLDEETERVRGPMIDDKVRRYHCAVYLPIEIERLARRGMLLLDYSSHARHQSDFKSFQLPATLDTSIADVVEVELERPLKVLYRVAYNSDLDLCLVVQPTTRLVRTAWVNHRRDLHDTLNRSLYEVANGNA